MLAAVGDPRPPVAPLGRREAARKRPRRARADPGWSPAATPSCKGASHGACASRPVAAAWLRGRSAVSRLPPPMTSNVAAAWTRGPRHGCSSLDACDGRGVKVKTASTRVSWVAKVCGKGQQVPSSHGGQPVLPWSMMSCRRGRVRWLGAHLKLFPCSLTAAHHVQLPSNRPWPSCKFTLLVCSENLD